MPQHQHSTSRSNSRRRQRRFVARTSVLSPLSTFLFLLLFLAADVSVQGSLRRPAYTEDERQAEYIKRGHKFPFPHYVPDTEGWKRLMDQRFTQVQALTDAQMKWDGWIQTISSAVTVPNFTEYGWGLSQAPQSLTDDLRQAVFDGLPAAREEGEINVIGGPNRPLFIDRPDLTHRALQELKPILEAWSGMELIPSIAYGFRLYRNESSLWMHIDRTQTHVISCIYHIASSDDSDPWPIVIEDYDGNTQAAVLQPGDILLYESAKNFHGRPTVFYGSWYTSLFVHFFPKEGWSRENHDLDSHYAIPPTWADVVPNVTFPKLEVVGTSMREPACPFSWCNLQASKHVEGPGEYGTVLTTNGKKYRLKLEKKGVIDEL
ncbi:hypothetical protein IV203_011908 [Nitzschia inconspicua]|uniref:Prolyl 4-hydroxylase alpha subunit domain-containing protein n=1 Tax=Nitzschia inconspicua TaxID=303405 RepID=A0A9K3KTK6_9STRA|nr:hypothetical protein IV203_011908 [Nitzschia inconspicua]